MRLKRYRWLDPDTGELVMVAIEHEYGTLLVNTSKLPNRQACENLAMLDMMVRYGTEPPE